MQFQDQYLNEIHATLELDIPFFQQSVLEDQWQRGLPNFQKSQLSVKIKGDILYMAKIMSIIKKTCVAPNDFLLKSMLLLVVKQTVRNSSLVIIQHCFEELIYKKYQIQSPSFSKFYRKATQKVIDAYAKSHQIDYSILQEKLISQLKNRSNLFTVLNIIICIFKFNKFIMTSQSDKRRNMFLQHCYNDCVEILKQNIDSNPGIVMACCKLISNGWGFAQSICIFYNKNVHDKEIEYLVKILKSKWYLQGVQQKYKNTDSLQSIYLHSKKSVVKAVNSFIKKLYRGKIQKKPQKKKIKQKQQNHGPDQKIKQLMMEIINQLQYNCYPSKLITLYILFVKTVLDFYQHLFNIDLINKLQIIFYKFMLLKPQQEEKIILKPFQYELQFRDYTFLNKNVRIMAVSLWVSMSFNRNKYNPTLSHQSLNIIKKYVSSNDLLQIQMALTLMSFIQYKSFKQPHLKKQPVIFLNSIIGNLISSSSVVLRLSSLRALCRAIQQNTLDFLSDSDILKLIQITYDHLTKDEAILVRIYAGQCFLRLSLKQRCIEQFKLTMYECLVVLLKIIQQVTLEAIGGLINSVLKIKQYEEILLPLSKQILQYSLNTFVEIMGKHLKYTPDQQNQIDTLLLLTQCAEMIQMFILNLSTNDLLPNGTIQEKLYTTLMSVKQLLLSNNKSLLDDQQLGQNLMKIISAVLVRCEKCEQKLLDIFVLNMKNFLLTQNNYLYSNVNIVAPLINLTKHLQKTINPSEYLQLIVNVRKEVFNHQEEKYSQIYLNILDYYLIVNVLTNQNIKQTFPNQYQYISNLIINNRFLNKFDAMVIKSGICDKFKGMFQSFSLLYSGAVLYLYDKAILGSHKQILNFTNNLFTIINNKYDKNQSYADNTDLKVLFKTYILCNLSILARLIQNPGIVFQKQQKNNNNNNNNSDAIEVTDVKRLTQNIINLFKKYLKFLQLFDQNLPQAFSQQNQSQMQDQLESNGQEDDDMIQFGEGQEQGQDQLGFNQFKFSLCYNKTDGLNQLTLLKNMLSNNKLHQLIPAQFIQTLTNIGKLLSKIDISQQDIVSMMIKN